MEQGNTFALSARHRRVQDRARATARAVAPYAPVADEATDVDPDVRRLLADSGLARLVVPARFGGEDEHLDPLAVAVTREALMYESAHADSLFSMQGIGSYALAIGGTPEVQEEWLPRVARLEAIPALGLTEPDVGSDLRAITTALEEVDGVLRLRGSKSFITNGGAADFYSILAREGDGYSLVLLPTDTPGLRVTRGADLIAPHVIGELEFDVTLPTAYRIGLPGKGFRLVLQTLAVFRVSVAGAAVGLAQAALDEAIAHATTRTQSGRPLAEIGAVSQSLAASWTDVEASRALTYVAAARAGTDPLAALDFASLAKAQATEAAGRVVDRAVQTMGRFGLVAGSKIERLYRGARPLRIYEGSTEVLRDALARRLVKDAL